MSPPCIILSGCHAGPNPSPGLGTARSLRLALPEAILVGKDHSPLASGLHAAEFDQAWLCAPWDQLDLEAHRREIESRLEDGWLISGFDLETEWLAGTPHPRILIPPYEALGEVAKPSIRAAGSLPLRLPRWIGVDRPARDLASFCRRAGWNVWVKGKHHEARRARSWPEIEQALGELTSRWGSAGLFLQADVEGLEESLVFAAFEGRLLGAAYLIKNAVTESGKAWAGTIRPPPSELTAALAAVLRRLRWTGGGELECIRDKHGERWLLDWNPRFPAWIHGATIAGINLPGTLIAAATGTAPQETPHRAGEFIRTVVEVPVRSGLPLPVPHHADRRDVELGKHPSAMSKLAVRLAPSMPSPTTESVPIEGFLGHDLTEAARGVDETPSRVFLSRTAKDRFGAMAERARRIGFQVAYSVKTNPAPELMQLALEHGFLAETIGREEVEWALAAGFDRHQLVYNGPVPRGDWDPLRAVFADSVESFAGYVRRIVNQTIGVRLRPRGIASRFGVDLEDSGQRELLLKALGSASKTMRLGISMHVPEDRIGLERWLSIAAEGVDTAARLEQASGREVSVLNLGGGWASESLGGEWDHAMEQVIATARAKLRRLREIVIEPGRCLAEPTQALLTRVVEVRAHGGQPEVVVDGSIADVPTAIINPHRVALCRSGCWEELGRGPGPLLGRSCMENDVLARDLDLSSLRTGDLLAVLDVGAYDASMAYHFGVGGSELPATANPTVESLPSTK